MKKKFLFSLAALSVALLTFSGCSDDIDYGADGNGEGRVLLRPMLSTDVVGTVSAKAPAKGGSRAGVTNDELAAKTLIWISNSKGVVRKFNGVGQLPAEGIWLMADNYVAEAWAGDSVSASFEHKYFKAREPFSVSAGQTLQIDLECKIANVVVEVKYDDSLKDAIKDVSLTAGHKRGTLTYTGFEMEGTPGYFMMPSTDKNISYTFTAKTVADNKEITKSDVIKDVKPGYKYILHVKHNGGGDADEIGAGLFTITVDESEIEVAEQILLESAPVISGLTFDITQPIYAEAGKLTEHKVWIQSVHAIESVEVSCPTGFDALGIGGTDFEIFGMDQTVVDQLAAHGFHFNRVTHADDPENPKFEEVKLVFGETFLNLLPNGEHNITITVTDAGGRVGMGVIRLVLSDATVQTEPVAADSPEIWPTQATLRGTVLKENAGKLGFNWREVGTQQWNYIEAGATASAAVRRRSAKRAPAVGDSFTAVLTGLTPGKTYEYQAVCDEAPAATCTLTTEAALQLPNASFEEWARFKSGNDTKDVLHIASDAASMFWDSGNHGSATLNKEVTEQASDKVHSGQYSAKLCSQFVGISVMGKFAAGNLFVGRYLETLGTNGVLGWGRSFSSRPKALRVWVHYTPGTVEYVHDKAPDIVKDQPDKGIIYIAIVDNTKTDYSSNKCQGEKWPCIVNTKTSELFNKDGDNVIAYGEHVFTEATAGSDLVQVEIPLDYRRTDAKAENIIITCSASKGGDYFAGGNSVMYLDDFELVY